MIKNFNNNIVLTSQTREAVLVFKYAGANRYIVPSYDASTIGVSSFYVNGIDLTKVDAVNYKIKTNIALNATTPAVFHVFTKSANDYDINLRFTGYTTSGLTSIGETIDVSISNRPFIIEPKDFNLYSNDKIIVDNESSYLVMRTNPKFSGNIKLIVDSNDNLFLDTFKVSDILSNKKYRKQQVSAGSTFSSDIRKVFGSIPSGELYKVDKENTLDVALPKTEIYKQFNTTYNYGARLFEDELYSEDYSILAPIWINSVLPDFFAIFRLDGVHNPETYKETSDAKISDLATKYLKSSNLVKSWSLNQKNNLGKYLYTHLNELVKTQSPVYLPLTDYDHNVWNGISVNSGIISSSQETSYQFEKTVDNFTDMNAFISSGFERNNMLCPNLLNLEYAFNDDSANMYSMHRYFGLYLSENVLYKIAYYKESDTASTFRILSLDGKDINDFVKRDVNSTNSIFSSEGSVVHTEFQNRIFAINNNNNLTRLTSANQIDVLSFVDPICNKIGDNIFTSNVVKRDISQFITVNLNNPLLQGDHFRVINKTKSIIWEIYGIDVINIDKGESYTYCSSNLAESGYPIVYRNAFSITGEVSNQIIAARNAFNLFDEFDVSSNFIAYKNSDNSFSIIVDKECTDSFSFQHITSQQEVTNGVFTNEVTPTYVNFFGQSNGVNLYNTVLLDASYGPINFEYHGNRNNVIVDFIKTTNNLYSLTDNVTDKFQPYMYYQNINGWNKLIQSFDVSINSVIFNYQYVNDPNSDQNKYMVATEDVIIDVNDSINVYSVFGVNISLMSVNSVKDFDFNIYDETIGGVKSEYFYKRADDDLAYSKSISDTTTITNRNSYLITNGVGSISFNGSVQTNYNVGVGEPPFSFNTFFGPAIITPGSVTKVSYSVLDGSTNFVGYNVDYSEEKKSNYYVKDSSSILKYGLTSPYVTKWVMTGTDCRNNEMRLILDSSTNDSSTNGSFTVGPNDTSVMSNFIPLLDNSIFSNEVSIPSFKYLSTATNDSWKKYVYYDINDSILDNVTNEFVSIKDAMMANPFVDVFSKLMFSNNGIDEITNRTSILGYNKYKNSVDTVYSGLKLSISSNKNVIELASIENYNRYKFGFISTSSRNYGNNSAIEVFINENTRTVLMVWYQGNDLLNYYYRNSSYNPGKSILNNANSDKSLTAFNSGVDASSFSKSPFWLNTNLRSITSVSINSKRKSFTSEESSPVIQLTHNKFSNIGSVFVAYALDNSINRESFESVDDTYDNFSGVFNYTYSGNRSTVGSYVINQSNTYETNKNLYANETCDVNLLNNLLLENDLFYTIIRQDKIYDNNTFGKKAFSVSINNPNIYKNKLSTHNGGFFPKFKTILSFSTNENSTIIDISKKDFVAGNTNLISYNNIDQMWSNKVVATVSDKDIADKDAIRCQPNYNLFNSLWDNAFYTMSNDSSTAIKVNGYESPVELPAFFGSKLIKLPHTINLNKWDSLNSSSTFLNNEVVLKFNLSLTLRRIFKNEPSFVANWLGLQNSSQFIDQYINNTVLKYYSISLPSLSLKLYSKNSGTLSISGSYLDSMTEITNQNFFSELVYEKGEYFYLINIKNTYNNLTYYAEITLNQK